MPDTIAIKTIIFLASELGATGDARQLSQLARGLDPRRFRVELFVVNSPDGPIADELKASGQRIHLTNVRGIFDIRGLRNLRKKILELKPEIIHTWSSSAALLATLVQLGAAENSQPSLVASALEPFDSGLLGWLTKLILQRLNRVVARTWAESERYLSADIRPNLLTRIPPGVAATNIDSGQLQRREFLKSLELPENARIIVTSGRIEPSAGLKAAIWAFDMLRYEFPNLYLLIFGSGPDRAGLEQFGQALAFDDFRVRFPGSLPNFPEIIRAAEVIWIVQERGGTNLALEAMAAGRPIVAWKNCDLGEVIEPENTGFLVDSKARSHLSARTHELLTNHDKCHSMGSAALIRVRESFPLERAIKHFERLYDEICPNTKISNEFRMAR